MSLYDDAAFICLPTGGAVKNETVYNLKPELILGDDVVTNGDFSTNGTLSESTYSLGWTVSSVQQGDSVITAGQLKLSNDAGETRADAYAADGSSANLLLDADQQYYVQYTVVATTGTIATNGFRVYAGSTNVYYPSSEVGTHSVLVTHNGVNKNFIFQLSTASTSITLDNVSVKKVKQAPKDFTTFSRGSDLTATRVAADGMIQKGRKNLQRNTVFAGAGTDTAPTGYGTHELTGDATYAPHPSYSDRIVFEVTDASGSSPADRAFLTSNSSHYTSDGVYTASVYVNAVTGTAPAVRDVVNLVSSGTITKIAWFENGVPITESTTISANKRYGVSAIFSGSSIIARYGLGCNADITANATVTLSKPQVERGQVPTSYIENKSTSAESAVVGMITDEPRICYEGAIGGCPSLLLEPKRTNLTRHSEYFGDWDATNVTIESCPAQKDDWFGQDSDLNTRSPEGLYNATLVTETATTGNHLINETQGPFVTGEYYTYSIYVKKAGRDKFRIKAGTFGVIPVKAEFDLTAVTATVFTEGDDTGEGNPYIYDVGNGWYRCCVEGIQCSAPGSTGANILLMDGSDTYYAGDTGKGLLFYGLQVEEAPTSSPDADARIVTSYIPNYGASSLTRNHDEAVLNNGNLELADYMVGENVTWFVELAENRDVPRDYGGSSIRMSEEGNLGSLRIYRSATAAQRFTTVFQDKDGLFVPSGIEHTGAAPKFCITRDWGSGRIKVFHDGVEVKDDVNANMARWNRILLDGEATAIRVKQIAAWDRVLTDQECIDLTS